MPSNLHHQVNEIDTIVHGISMLIRDSLTIMEAERTHPESDSDRMDDKITHFRERAAKLRKLREEFENEMCRTY